MRYLHRNKAGVAVRTRRVRCAICGNKTIASIGVCTRYALCREERGRRERASGLNPRRRLDVQGIKLAAVGTSRDAGKLARQFHCSAPGIRNALASVGVFRRWKVEKALNIGRWGHATIAVFFALVEHPEWNHRQLREALGGEVRGALQTLKAKRVWVDTTEETGEQLLVLAGDVSRELTEFYGAAWPEALPPELPSLDEQAQAAPIQIRSKKCRSSNAHKANPNSPSGESSWEGASSYVTSFIAEQKAQRQRERKRSMRRTYGTGLRPPRTLR